MAEEVKLKFTADTSNAIGGINKLKGSLDGLKGAAAGISGAIAGIGIVSGISTLTSAIKDTIVGSSKAAASYETMAVQLEVLTGSAETAGTLLKQLTALGAKTPLEQTDLQQGTKTLLAFGVGVKDIIPSLEMLGDIAMGDGQKLQSLANAFGKIASSGKATMETINIMIDAGFNPLTSLAKKSGISMEEMMKRVSDGQVTFEDIKNSMEQATSAGGMFFEMMKRIANTTEGKLSNFADNVTRLKVAFGTGFNVGLGTTLDGINNRMTGLEASFKRIGDAAGKMLVDVTPAIEKFIKELPAALESGSIWTTVATNLINVFNDPAVVDAVGKLAEAFYPGGQKGLTATKYAGIAVGSFYTGKVLKDMLLPVGAWLGSNIAGLVKSAMATHAASVAAGGAGLGTTVTAAGAGATITSGLAAATVAATIGYGIGKVLVNTVPYFSNDINLPVDPRYFSVQKGIPPLLANPNAISFKDIIPKFLKRDPAIEANQEYWEMRKREDATRYSDISDQQYIDNFFENLRNPLPDIGYKKLEENMDEVFQSIPNLTSLGKIGGAAGETSGRAIVNFQQQTLQTQQDQLNTQKSMLQIISEWKLNAGSMMGVAFQ